jgi:rhodanese-related sulfurtransferase
VNLTEQHYWEEKGRLPMGGAVKLFFEPCMDRILLVSVGGDVAILPECPKCVKILHLTDRTVTDAAYEDHRMTFTYNDGETETFSMSTADRIRVSLSFVKEALAAGGELIDVRPQHRRLAEGPIPCTAAVDPEELDDYLKNKDPDTRLFFICSFGTVADQATWHAYRLGFHNARSVGGWHRGMHID